MQNLEYYLRMFGENQTIVASVLKLDDEVRLTLSGKDSVGNSSLTLDLDVKNNEVIVAQVNGG